MKSKKNFSSLQRLMSLLMAFVLAAGLMPAVSFAQDEEPSIIHITRVSDQVGISENAGGAICGDIYTGNGLDDGWEVEKLIYAANMNGGGVDATDALVIQSALYRDGF